MGTLIIWRPLWASGILVVCGDIIIHGSILQVNKRRDDLLCFSVHHPDLKTWIKTNKHKLLGLLHLYVGIFKTVAFSMWFRLLSAHKQNFKSPKLETFENKKKTTFSKVKILKVCSVFLCVYRKTRVLGLSFFCFWHHLLCETFARRLCLMSNSGQKADAAKTVRVLTFLPALFTRFYSHWL